MAYPQHFEQLYINPSGNIEASGYFKSHITQELANMYPYWTAIRDDRGSVAQQYMSPTARTFYNLEKELSAGLNEKFINLAPVDEVDVLYRIKIPSTISFLNSPRIECWTSPSGSTPSGSPFPELAGADPDTYNSFQISEVNDLEEFYYHVLPTRLKAYDSEPYSDERADSIGVSFPVKPSGMVEPFSKYVDSWKREHDITWAHDNIGGQKFLKQDAITMETYESYESGLIGSLNGFTFYNGMLWWIGGDASSPWGIPSRLKDSVVVEYKLDDYAANAVVLNEYGTDGVLVGGKTTEDVSVTGKIKEAFEFDGAVDLIDCNDTFQTLMQDTFSCNFWTKLDDGLPSGTEYMLGNAKKETGIPYFSISEFSMITNSGGAILVIYSAGGFLSQVYVSIPDFFSDEPHDWIMFTIVVSNETRLLSLYANTVLIGSMSMDGTFPAVMSNFAISQNMFVGANHTSRPSPSDVYGHYHGAIDNFCLFDKELTEDEISSLYILSRQLNISNPHPTPSATCLDTLATFDLSELAIDPSGSAPSGVDIDEEGHIWILDEDRENLYALDAMYDYFLVDKETRYTYFREDYSNPGVFIKPA